MSEKRIEAVYEQGAFRPVAPLAPPLREGQRVRLTVEATSGPAAYLDLATRVFDGLSDEDVAAIEAMTRRRTEFFGADKNSGEDA